MGAAATTVMQIAEELGMKTVDLAGKNGSVTPHFSADQWQEIAAARGQRAPEGHMTMTAMARSINVGTERMQKIIDDLGIVGAGFLTSNGHQTDHFTPEQFLAITESLGVREKASEEYKTVRGLRDSLGASRVRINQIIEDFEIEGEEMLMTNGRKAVYYTPEDCSRIERILNLWRNGGSPLRVVEDIGTSPLVTGLMLESPAVKNGPSTEEDFFSRNLEASVIQKFIRFRRAQKSLIQQLQERFSGVIPLSYFAAENGESLAGVMTLVEILNVDTFRIKLNEKKSLLCSSKSHTELLQEAVAAGKNLIC